MKSTYKALLYFASIFFVAACENQTSLLSEETIRENLEHDWRPIPETSNYGASTKDKTVYWRFKQGELKVLELKNGKEVTQDSALYTIDAKLENPTLKIEGFSSSALDTTYGFNTLWTFIQIDGNVLDLAGNPSNGGLVELEFTKK